MYFKNKSKYCTTVLTFYPTIVFCLNDMFYLNILDSKALSYVSVSGEYQGPSKESNTKIRGTQSFASTSTNSRVF